MAKEKGETPPTPKLARLVSLMARLRAPGGCPWDREQTHESLKPYLIEEAYEVLEAIDGGSAEKLKEELGDLLLQVAFHAQLAAERGGFDIEEVARTITDKLLRRHPHVFGERKVRDSREVLHNWEVLKRSEREGEDAGGEGASVLEGVPRSLPSLLRAQRLQEKASRVGFDWPDVEGPRAKVGEEWEELRRAMDRGASRAELAGELGDLLFACVNLARFLDLSAEEALRATIEKFSSRFREVERRLAAGGRRPEELSLEALDALWEEVKGEEGGGGGP